MAYLQAVMNALVVVGVGVLITWVTRTQIKDLRGDLKEDIGELKQELRDFRVEVRAELRDEIASVRADLRQEMGSVRSELGEQVGSVRGELAALRADLTQIALAVGARPRPQAG